MKLQVAGSKIYNQEALIKYESYLLELNGILPLSANIDMMLLFLNLKPCMRTLVIEQNYPFQKFLNSLDLYFRIGEDNYIYISSSKENLDRAFYLDNQQERSQTDIGKLFGYPKCCSRKIENVGEENIDDFELSLSRLYFDRFFKLINPKNYRKGTAFISHVPCSQNCIDSLFIAQKFSYFILSNINNKSFEGWKNELEIIYGES